MQSVKENRFNSLSTLHYICNATFTLRALVKLNRLGLDVTSVCIESKTIKIATPGHDFIVANLGDNVETIIKKGNAITTAKMRSVKVIYEQPLLQQNRMVRI